VAIAPHPPLSATYGQKYRKTQTPEKNKENANTEKKRKTLKTGSDKTQFTE
jgi:hypothetical protein